MQQTSKLLRAALIAMIGCASTAAEMQNLVKNADFKEREAAHPDQFRFWAQQVRPDANGYRPTATFSIVPGIDGEPNAIRIQIPPPGKTGKSAALILQQFKLKPNTNYYVSCYRKPRSSWTPVFFDLRDKDRKFVKAFGLDQTENNGQDQFNLCEKKFRTGPDIHYGQFMLTIQNLGFGEAEFNRPTLLELPE